MAVPRSVYFSVLALHILNQKAPDWAAHEFVTINRQHPGLLKNMAQLRSERTQPIYYSLPSGESQNVQY